MAELDGFDYEVRDEELVDFEGSDYGFGSDEELDLEEEANAALSFGLEDEAQKSADVAEKVTGNKVQSETIVEGDLAGFSASTIPAKRQGAESGEIEDERDEKDDGVVVQVVSGLSSTALKECAKDERKLVESRRRHRKADLEDGELDDAAMPEGSDHEAEGIPDGYDEDEKDRRDRKRRKDRFFAERLSDDLDRKRSDSVMAAAARLQRNRGRQFERSDGFSKASSACGRGIMQMGRFGNNPSMAPGIMGPGGPLMHIDMGPAVTLRPMSRGFVGPVAGMPLPSEVSMSQLQEAMAVHEQMLWSQRMIQQCAQAAGHPGRNLSGSLPGFAMRPVGLDFNGPLPRDLLHLPAQGPNLTPQVNFGESMENPLSRVSRAGYGSLRGMPLGGGVPSQVPGRPGPSPREGNMIRQSSWPSALLQSKDVPAVGRGRAHVRGRPAPIVWPNPHNVRQAFVQSQARLGQSGGGQSADVRHSGCPEMVEGSAAKVAHNSNGPMGSGDGRAGATLAVRMGSDETSNLRMNSNASIAPGSVRYGAPTQHKHSSSSQNSSRSASADWHGNVSNTSSNLINLGGPVQKSRLLTVSGLPENTSMSVVVEAFENQGKVMDFRKEERGDAFTITFASIVEAISAKRHLHRSIIAGRQITVEYAVQ